MAKVANTVLRTPVINGERIILHPETNASNVIVDEDTGTTLDAKLDKIDEATENTAKVYMQKTSPNKTNCIWFQTKN